MRRNIVGFFAILATVFLMLLLCKSAKAQQAPFELTWRSGQVILTSGDTIYGITTLTNPSDIIRVTRQNGAVSTFSAVNVASFEVSVPDNVPYLFRRSRESSVLDVRRIYKKALWDHDRSYSNFKSPAFFNVLESGNYSLLRREVKERTYDNTSGMYSRGPQYSQEIIVDKFYLQLPDEKIIALRNPKKDLTEALPKFEKQLLAYAKENKLSFSEPIELVQIIRYLNSLQP